MAKYVLYCGGILTCDYDNTADYKKLDNINNGGNYDVFYQLTKDSMPTNPTDATAFVYNTETSVDWKTNLRVIHSCCSPKMRCTYQTPYNPSNFNLFSVRNNNIWSEEYLDDSDNLVFSFLAQYDKGDRLPQKAPSWFGIQGGINTVDYSFINEIDRYNGSDINNVPSATTEGMFSGCTELTSCDVPCEMRYISDYTFSGCTSLTDYTTTPQFVEHIGVEAFKNCTSITDIKIGQFCGISRSSFEDCTNARTITFDGVESDGNGKCNMTQIPDYAFMNCTSLQTTNFEDNSNSFLGIPNSVTSIGDSSFAHCESISNVILGYDREGYHYPDTAIGSGVTSIGDNAFYECTGMRSLTIGSGITSIGQQAFQNCLIETLYYNSSVALTDEIFDWVGFDDQTLLDAVIGNNTTEVGRYAFYGCENLTSVTIGNSVTSIGSHAFYNCSSLHSLDILDTSLEEIKISAFQSCTSLTSVFIPSSIVEIGESAFENCTNLYNLSIGDNSNYSETIGVRSFLGCSSLETVTIPSSVNYIGDSAFSGCTNLNSIYVRSATPPTLENYVFNDTNNCNIYVPRNSYNSYINSQSWSNYTSRIVAYDF